jgi:hypothetical protein
VTVEMQHDLLAAAANLELVLDTIKRSQTVSARQIYGSDFPSPRLDLLLIADTPMQLACFHLRFAEQSGPVLKRTMTT